MEEFVYEEELGGLDLNELMDDFLNEEDEVVEKKTRGPNKDYARVPQNFVDLKDALSFVIDETNGKWSYHGAKDSVEGVQRWYFCSKAGIGENKFLQEVRVFSFYKHIYLII